MRGKRLDGKRGGVVADPEVDPPITGSDVVDTTRCHLAEFRNDEVMHPDRLGLSLRTQLTPAILEVANEFLLLGVDRDDRLASSLERLYFRIDPTFRWRHANVPKRRDVLELSVTVGMAWCLRASLHWLAG
jgi:hypothetical protein